MGLVFATCDLYLLYVRLEKLARKSKLILFVCGLCSNFDMLFLRDMRKALDKLSATVSPKGMPKNVCTSGFGFLCLLQVNLFRRRKHLCCSVGLRDPVENGCLFVI